MEEVVNQQTIIDNLNVEKIALDQSYVDQIKLTIELRKHILMKDKCIQDMNIQLQQLLADKTSMKSELDELTSIKEDLQNSLAVLHSATSAE